MGTCLSQPLTCPKSSWGAGGCSPCSLGCPGAPQPWQGSEWARDAPREIFPRLRFNSPPFQSQRSLHLFQSRISSLLVPVSLLLECGTEGFGSSPEAALPGLGWAGLGDPQQRQDLLLDKSAPEIPVAHHRVNRAGSKAAAKPALAALSMGIGGAGRSGTGRRGRGGVCVCRS